MRRYLIIAIAIMAAILVMSLIKAVQTRRAKARGETPPESDGIGVHHIIGACAGLAVFFIGAILLESGAADPTKSYQPATLQDGKITSGGFDDGG